MRLTVFASHGGSILQAVLDACANNTIAGEVALVVSNNKRARALTRATDAQIPTFVANSHTHPDPVKLGAALTAACQQANSDWIVLAGYMKKLDSNMLAAYEGRIINAHPALIPKYSGAGFYGSRVHEAVLKAGEKETGATVHLVDANYDTGPILSQVRVPVKPNDTVDELENRVKKAERNLVITTLSELCSQRKAS